MNEGQTTIDHVTATALLKCVETSICKVLSENSVSLGRQLLLARRSTCAS